MKFRFILPLVAAAAFSASTHAQDYKLGDLQITHPYARATVPNQPSGSAYFGIENKGKKSDRLVGIATPLAKSAEIHTMSMEGNVMKMREAEQIEIAPSTRITMKPGEGYHVMLLSLRQPLKVGDKFPLTLTFEKAGKVDVTVSVEDKSAGMDHMQHMHQH